MADVPEPTIDIVDSPFRISRLLGLLPDDRPYLVTWLTAKITLHGLPDDAGNMVKLKTPRVEHRTECVILTREPDGGVKIWGAFGEAIPAEWDVRLGYVPPAASLLSAKAFKHVQADLTHLNVDVPCLFRQLVEVIDRFVDFSFSVADQQEVAELLAVYILATWLSDAFAVFPYLWPNGDKGAGKTKVVTLIGKLGYLGTVILAGGTYAALRDLSEYGATLCFDDAENLADPKTSDPDKRALLLAGNRKGTVVPVKEPEGKNGWRIRNVSAYAPKVFSAIRQPDPVLARRTITLPLVRSADPDRANHDVEEEGCWPHPRRALVDDAWLFGLRYLAVAKREYEAMRSSDLVGPAFEPWRPLFATAKVLEDAGVDGLLHRIQKIARTHQDQREDFEVLDITRLTIKAIAELVDVRTLPDAADVLTHGGDGLTTSVQFTAAQVAAIVNEQARNEGLVDGDEEYTTAKKIGHVLDRLRITRIRGNDRKRTRQRSISRLDALKLHRAYGLADDPNSDDETAERVPGKVDESQPETSATSTNVQMSNGHHSTDAVPKNKYVRVEL